MLKPIMHTDTTVYVSGDDSGIDWQATCAAYLTDRAKAAERLRGIATFLGVNGRPVEDLAREVVTPDPVSDKAACAWLIGDDAAKSPGSTAKHYKAIDGEKLTRFVLGVLPPGEAARIADECKIGGEQMLWRAFLSGLRDIENFDDHAPKVRVDGVEYVDPSWLRKRFGRGLRGFAIEVGRHIWLWNQMSEADSKN